MFDGRMDHALPAIEEDTFRRVPAPHVRRALDSAGLTLVGPGPAPGWVVRLADASERLVSHAVGTHPGRSALRGARHAHLHPVLDVVDAGEDEVIVCPPIVGRRLRTLSLPGAAGVAGALVAAAHACAALTSAGLGPGTWELGDLVVTPQGDLVVWVPAPAASTDDDVAALVRSGRETLGPWLAQGDPDALRLDAALAGLEVPTPDALVAACVDALVPPPRDVWSRLHGAPAGAAPTLGPADTEAGTGGGAASLPGRGARRRDVTDLRASRRRTPRARRTRRVPAAAVVGVVIVGLVGGALGGAAIGRWLRAPDLPATAERAVLGRAGGTQTVPHDAPDRTATTAPARSAIPTDPAQAAQVLTTTRIALLVHAEEVGARGNPDPEVRNRLRADLALIHAPGSALGQSDAALLDALLDGTAEVGHAGAQARSARVARAGSEPVVEVVYAMAARDGSLDERVAVLRLVSDGGRWRVADVVQPR